MRALRLEVLLGTLLWLAMPAAAQDACPKIPLVGRDAQGVQVASAPSAWGGVQHGDNGMLSDRVVRYEIDAKLDPIKHTITGKQRLTWRNRSAQPVCSVYLHLYLNAFEGPGSTFMTEQRNLRFGFRSEVAVGDGEWGFIELKRVQQGGQAVPWRFVQPDGGPSTDRTVARLDLPAPVAPGASTTLDIDFFDQLPRVSARTGYFGTFHLIAQWFPKIGVLELSGERGATEVRWNAHEFHLHSEFYADFGSFDVRLTVPKGYTVGATGEEVGAPACSRIATTHHFVQDDVHDFAWTADSRYAEPMLGTYSGVGSPKVQIKVLYPPEFASNAKPALTATIDALRYFSETLGPYPYRTVTVVVPPHNADEAGGMEYPTFFTTISVDDVTPRTLNRYFLDYVTIHEFGHGYFYGILASNEFEEPMLDEGINDYWNHRMLRKDPLHAATPFLKRIGIDPVIQGFDVERLSASLRDPADPLGQNSWNRLSSRSYGTVYSRTATTMRDLEAQVGTPAMERAFKLYYERWKFRHPSVADLREALAEGTGKRAIVEQIFAQQVYDAQKVNDRIESFSSSEELPQAGYVERNGKRSEQTSEQIETIIRKKREAWTKKHPDAKAHEGPFPYRTTVVVRREGAALPQELQVKFADGSRETARVDASRSWQRFTFIKPARAASAELDPNGRIYLDADRLDNSRTLTSNQSAARRWAGELVALLMALFSVLVSV